MAEAQDISARRLKNGSATLLARTVATTAPIYPRRRLRAEYSVYLLDDRDPDGRTAVFSHTSVSLVVGEVLYGPCKPGPLWTVDFIGYNFKHALEVARASRVCRRRADAIWWNTF